MFLWGWPGSRCMGLQKLWLQCVRWQTSEVPRTGAENLGIRSVRVKPGYLAALHRASGREKSAPA